MNELQLRQTLVNNAVSYVGATSGSKQHLEILSIYNGIRPLPRSYAVQPKDAWCATFGSAMAAKSNMLDIIPAECSCPKQIELWQAKGRWQENDAYVPSPGDYIYYDWQDSGSGDNRGVADHVGIVTKVADGVITVIEGNKGSPSQVGYRNIALNGRYIRGFGLPDFKSKATESVPVTPQTPAKPAAKVATSAMPLLKSGAKNQYVEVLQNFLIGLGYSCGKDGADGDFGAKTKTAVINFQNGHNLIPDGEVGPLTWAAIRKALPMVARGSKSYIVKALQILLNINKCNCGTPDKDFGKKTNTAVISYQKSHGLEPDGQVGPLTWTKLLGC